MLAWLFLQRPQPQVPTENVHHAQNIFVHARVVANSLFAQVHQVNLMLTLNGPGGYWSWCSFICELDIVYTILCFVVCNSQDVSFAQTCKTRCSSISQFFTSTSLCFIKCFCNKTCYRRLLNYFLAIKVQSWGRLRPKVESITLTPIANYCIPLFACAFCHGHVEIPLYQQQNRLISLVA